MRSLLFSSSFFLCIFTSVVHTLCKCSLRKPMSPGMAARAIEGRLRTTVEIYIRKLANATNQSPRMPIKYLSALHSDGKYTEDLLPHPFSVLQGILCSVGGIVFQPPIAQGPVSISSSGFLWLSRSTWIPTLRKQFGINGSTGRSVLDICFGFKE